MARITSRPGFRRQVRGHFLREPILPPPLSATSTKSSHFTNFQFTTKMVVLMAKNPFMSAYLSAANRVANTARGHATNEVKRQSKKQSTNMMNAWVDAWTPKTTRKRKSR